MLVRCMKWRSFFREEPQVLIAENGKEGWTQNKKWGGLPFIVNDDTLLKTVKRGERIDENILKQCKALQTTDSFSDWRTLNTQDDIEILMNLAADFHDSTLESVKNDGADTYVKFFCWGSWVTIKFTNLLASNQGDGVSWGNNCILEAGMRFENGNIKWFVDSFAFTEAENQECYFIAEKAQYKINFIP